MKQFLIITICFFFLLHANAQQWINVDDARYQGEQQFNTHAELLSHENNQSTIRFHFDGFEFWELNTGRTKAVKIYLEEASPLLYKTAPDLPKLTASIIIPDADEMEAVVVSSSYKDFYNVDIAPSKGNLTRDIDPDDLPYEYGPAYKKNEFFPGKLTALRDPYILRDYRGQTLLFYPFQYNPVTKTLRVYYDITVKVKPTGNTGRNILERKAELSKIDPEFHNVYDAHFLNYQSAAKYTPLGEQGNMLIITYDAFASSIQPLADWKNKIGIPATIVNKSNIGNGSANAIKNYISSYYTTNGLTYVLLVGDATQIPTLYSGGDSDNSYAYLSGNDHYPDIFVGRFSAENTGHVQTQVQRTIDYEGYPSISGGWHNRGLGIASNQGPGDDNEYDHEHIHNIRTDLLNFTYNAVSELYDGTNTGSGWIDASGDPTASMVAQDINSGASVISYCGHGSTTSWGSSGFSTTNISALNNEGMLPFIFSVACVNGNFVSNTCFAETWLRATNSSGNPIGAVATIMSTINQSWDPPMEAQDEMIDILTESYSNNKKRTFGGITMNGCMKMNDTYGSSGDAMTDTWTIFGDPSLMVRTDTPQVMTVTHPNILNIGLSQAIVTCNVNDARVCLSMNGQILGTGTITNGFAIISFTALTTVDTIDVALTAFNHLPYIGEIPVLPGSGPFVSYASYTINDTSGNNNSLADYGENITLNVELQNLGIDTAKFVSAIMSTSDTGIQITDSTHLWGNIIAGNTKNKNNAFALNVSPALPDQHVASLNLSISDTANNNWTSVFNITIQAPDFSTGSMAIDDVTSGNGDGKLDPGESLTLTFNTMNIGHSDGYNTTATLSCSDTGVSIQNAVVQLDTLTASGQKTASFNVSLSSAIVIGQYVDFVFSVNSGAYSTQNTYSERVGIVSEDFETADFSQYNWAFSGNQNWKIDSTTYYDGFYSAVSGDITHNQSSEMMITINVMSGDTLSFYKKVDCEESPYSYYLYDYLEFFIDNSSKDTWDGDIDWSRESYYVSQGTHTLKWVYEKDNYVSDGSDCAWVDYIVFPPISVTTGMSDLILKGDLSVYPNPASDLTIIRYKNVGSKAQSLKLYSATANLIDVIKESNTQAEGIYSLEYNVSGLSKGIYFLILESEDQKIVKKLIKQ